MAVGGPTSCERAGGRVDAIGRERIVRGIGDVGIPRTGHHDAGVIGGLMLTRVADHAVLRR